MNEIAAEFASAFSIEADVDGDAKNPIKTSGERRLWGYTEGSVRSLNSFPGKNVGHYDLFQCIPMFNRDRNSKVTIIKHGNQDCEAMWNLLNDGCSSPVWSSYANAFEPACQRHDACK